MFGPLWKRNWQPTPVLLPGKSHGWRSPVGYSLWGCKESDTTERFHFVSFFFFGSLLILIMLFLILLGGNHSRGQSIILALTLAINTHFL